MLENKFTVPPVAAVERGVVLPIDVNQTHLVYPAGNNVVLRSLSSATSGSEEEDLFIFTKHLGRTAVNVYNVDLMWLIMLI